MTGISRDEIASIIRFSADDGFEPAAVVMERTECDGYARPGPHSLDPQRFDAIVDWVAGEAR